RVRRLAGREPSRVGHRRRREAAERAAAAPWPTLMAAHGWRPAMEGKKLPAVTFLDHEGKKVKSSELKLPAVLYFYPKDDTEGCTKEACGIRDHWAAFRKAGLHVYGVSKDDAKSHQKFIAKYDLPFPLLTADETQ